MSIQYILYDKMHCKCTFHCASYMTVSSPGTTHPRISQVQHTGTTHRQNTGVSFGLPQVPHTGSVFGILPKWLLGFKKIMQINFYCKVFYWMLRRLEASIGNTLLFYNKNRIWLDLTWQVQHTGPTHWSNTQVQHTGPTQVSKHFKVIHEFELLSISVYFATFWK